MGEGGRIPGGELHCAIADKQLPAAASATHSECMITRLKRPAASGLISRSARRCELYQHVCLTYKHCKHRGVSPWLYGCQDGKASPKASNDTSLSLERSPPRAKAASAIGQPGCLNVVLAVRLGQAASVRMLPCSSINAMTGRLDHAQGSPAPRSSCHDRIAPALAAHTSPRSPSFADCAALLPQTSRTLACPLKPLAPVEHRPRPSWRPAATGRWLIGKALSESPSIRW